MLVILACDTKRQSGAPDDQAQLLSANAAPNIPLLDTVCPSRQPYMTSATDSSALPHFKSYIDSHLLLAWACWAKKVSIAKHEFV